MHFNELVDVESVNILFAAAQFANLTGLAMKIAWVTPLAQSSAIGRVSATIVKALCARNHEVTIIRAERIRDDADSNHAVAARTIWWQDVSPNEIELDNDAIVLNLGDNYNFHAGALAFIRNVPCVGIFHDFYCYNLFNGWLAHNGLGEDIHQREVRYTYGASPSGLAKLAWRNAAPIEKRKLVP